MKIEKFTTNSSRTGHNLRTDESTYFFEGVSITLDTGLNIEIDGNANLIFDFENDGIEEEDRIIHFIDTCNITILDVYDELDESISLSLEIQNSIKHELQNLLELETVENY